ncbi:MAG: antifreeze protein [Rhodobacteraceae bacterium]|nr:MAG: antifreeze protein [Paracoccaceae bacterium]
MHSLIVRASQATRFWITCAQLTVDAQSVIAMRMMGMGGAWRLPRGESSQMVSEKLPAFTEALVAGTLQVMAGRRPDQVMSAVLEPLSERARTNRQRLLRQGPRIPGHRTALPKPQPE